MNSIRQRALNGEILSGGWLNLGSSVTAEITASASFDWVCVDLEHGAGGHTELLHQLQAIKGNQAAAFVRIACNETPRFKRVLDLGAEGIMIPHISTAEEAKLAVASMQFPPKGIRGVARLNRAAGFGENFDEYFHTANETLLTLTQIETKFAIKNIDAIAAVDGVDVLFVGPLDLSISLGIPQQYDHETFLEAMDKIVAACRKAGKAAGMHCFSVDRVQEFVKKGFTVLAIGSDSGLIAQGMKNLAASVNKYKN